MFLLEVLFYTFIGIVCIQVCYYILLFGNFAFIKTEVSEQKSIPISVIICARNEAENLKRFLPSILKQNYPNFEVVLINDGSNDETLNVMKQFATKHHNINIVDVKRVEAFWGNKKYALTLGIKASKYDHLLFTDADCEALTSNWILEMSKKFSAKKTIVLGYGGYFNIKNSFLNKLIRYETIMTAIQYFSYAKMGFPYMGVGRNLAYHKDEFFKANGFVSHIDVRSGDDDLFINEAATKTNTEICFSKDSITLSPPKGTFNAWITQKRRHISTSKHYKLKHKLLLGLFYITQFLFWGLALLLLILGNNWPSTLLLIAVRFLAVFMIINYSAKKLNETKLTAFAPILELFLILTQFGIFIANRVSKPKHWK